MNYSSNPASTRLSHHGKCRNLHFPSLATAFESDSFNSCASSAARLDVDVSAPLNFLYQKFCLSFASSSCKSFLFVLTLTAFSHQLAEGLAFASCIKCNLEQYSLRRGHEKDSSSSYPAMCIIIRRGWKDIKCFDIYSSFSMTKIRESCGKWKDLFKGAVHGFLNGAVHGIYH